MSNRIEFIWLWIAALRLGIIVATCNPDYTHEELVNQFSDCDVKAICYDETTQDKFRQAAVRLPNIEKKIVVDFVIGSEEIGFNTLINHEVEDAKALPKISPVDDIALILYSSGTTGMPKGVKISHQALINSHYCLSHMHDGPPAVQLTTNDVVLGTFKYFHGAGFIVTIWALINGASQICTADFSVQSIMESIQKWKVTHLAMVPPIVVGLAKSPHAVVRSSLKTMISMAAPLGTAVAKEITNKFGVKRMVQMFGMTELAFITHVVPVKEGNFDRVGSIGMPLPNCMAKIVCVETDELLGRNQRGEMWVKAPSVMTGYLNNDEATRDALTSDGWLKTGDVAYVDDDGYFYIVDRLKEMIKVHAYQVAPAELESLILKHEAVADVIVIGVPDSYAGELPRAYVVLKSGSICTEMEIMQHVREHVASYKQLKGGVEFVANLPKTGSGKLLRRQLRETARIETQMGSLGF